MNSEQKEQIRKLCSTGCGYAAIANALGLTKNQVSAFCRRNNLTETIGGTNTIQYLDHPVFGTLFSG
jgi:IS30 family transposase